MPVSITMKPQKIAEQMWDGILYPVSGRRDKAVIVMSGSEGGTEHAGKCAHFLQDNGIPALALGYFKTKHTPKALDRIPLETVESAIGWLRQRGYGKIGIEGASKGAEYALAAAIQFPELLSCVIVKTPSWFYSEGMRDGRPSGTSCWSYQGAELPFAPYRERKFHMLKRLWKAKEFNILEVNTGKEITPASVIPVERVKGPILILSVERDTIWPSRESGKRLEKRLSEESFAYPYKHVCYPHMSHMMLEYCGAEIKYFIRSEREFPEECAEERRAMGAECVRWLKEVWK